MHESVEVVGENPNESLNVYGLESGGLKILDYEDENITSAFRQLVDDEKARRELLQMAGLSKVYYIYLHIMNKCII